MKIGLKIAGCIVAFLLTLKAIAFGYVMINKPSDVDFCIGIVILLGVLVFISAVIGFIIKKFKGVEQ